MCFNKEVSIITYIVGCIGCIILIRNKYMSEAAFFLVVIQMQLIEYFLWKNQTCNNININITKLGIGINHMEPVILWLAILIFSKKILPKWVNAMMIVYILSAILYTIKINNNSCTTVTNESAPHLHWKWNNDTYGTYFYLFFLVTLIILSITGITHGYHLAILITTSFIISFIIYGKFKSVGAMWCFMAAFVPIIIPYFYKIKI